jgi:hypothetical protein
MLANLLPGIRDIRAPLTAGFIWLVAIWLLVEPEMRGDDSELTTSLDALADAVSPAGVGAALGVCAYLLGSASEAVTNAVVDWRSGRRKLWFVSHVPALTPASHLAVEELALDATAEASRRLKARGIAEREAYDTLVFTRRAREKATKRDQIDADARARLDADRREGVVYAHGSDGLEGWRDDVGRLIDTTDVIPAGKTQFVDAGPYDENWYSVLVANELEGVLGGEIEQMRTRLLVDQPELFSKVDRLRAEAEFRAAIAAPVVFLGGVLGLATGPWWLGLLTVALVPPLVLQGRRRADQSNDALVEALRIGKVSSPALDGVRALGTDAWIADVWRETSP